MTKIAETELEARRRGESRSLRIAISAPEIDPKDREGGSYRTLLEMEGFHRPMFIGGADSLQSLGLAFFMLNSLLQNMNESGWSIYYPGTDDLAEPTTYLFGKPPRD